MDWGRTVPVFLVLLLFLALHTGESQECIEIIDLIKNRGNESSLSLDRLNNECRRVFLSHVGYEKFLQIPCLNAITMFKTQ
jgi:hypothetical protein